MVYNDMFEENIPVGIFNEKTQGTLNWIKENREKFSWAKSPNAFEMANLFLFAGKYIEEGENIDFDVLTQMWQIRSKDFETCNISENHVVYKICEDAYESARNGKSLVNDENSHHALRKMAGIGLYLKQQQKNDEKISYHNPEELMKLMQASKTLKQLHPQLFQKYRFPDNINVICDLQLENDLSDSIKNQIQAMRENLLYEKNKQTHGTFTVPDER